MNLTMLTLRHIINQAADLLSYTDFCLFLKKLLPRFHAIEIVSAPRTKLSLAKKLIRGVCMANLKKKKIRPCYSTNNMENHSDLKIGLINIRSLAQKATLVNELITDHQVEILCLTETWLKTDEYIALKESAPPVILTFPV